MHYTFPQKDDFKQIDLPDLKKYNGNLILYGAGKVADVVDYVLRQNHIEYLCYCDTFRAGGTHHGHTIISPQELREKYNHVPVLITTIHHRSVMDTMEQLGEHEVFDSVPLLVDVDFSNWGQQGELMTQEWAIRTITSYLTTMLSLKKTFQYQELSVLLTQKCNLRCLDCCGLIPFIQAPRHFELNIIKESLKNLLDYDRVSFRDICLLGGEPLLYPHLGEILKYTLDVTMHENVSIVTNGTILPSDSLLELMKHERFFIRISDYGPLSRKKLDVINLLKDNGIKYEVDNYTEWYANREPLVAYCSEEEATRKFRSCTNIRYRILLENRFFPCCKAAEMCQMGLFKATSANSIDCLDVGDNFEKMEQGFDLLESCDHIDICHECYGIPQTRPDTMVPPAIQTNAILELKRVKE